MESIQSQRYIIYLQYQTQVPQEAFSEKNARHSHMDVIIGIISVTPSTFMIFMMSDGIIEINRCDDILFHRNLSLIHKPFHPWNSSEHETGDFSGLAQFYFLLLIYEPY